MTFTGFPPEALSFFSQLAADNSKAFWTAHKPTYDDQVRAPLVALTEALAPIYGNFTIFRPNRDIRFAKDKSPYKTNIACSAETEGGASVYIGFSADGLYAGTGYYYFAKDQLERYRAAVAAEGTGAALQKLVDAARKKGYEVHGESLKVAPRGYPKDHPRVELLRHHGLYVGKPFPIEPWLHTKAALAKVKTALKAAAPVAEWIDAHVGPTTILPEDWRRKAR
jgi:uncharacterized protein (TIGR02453 family)